MPPVIFSRYGLIAAARDHGRTERSPGRQPTPGGRIMSQASAQRNREYLDWATNLPDPVRDGHVMFTPDSN